ncbi:SDR family NAD(P)-dependent oxidoreductase, partial [Streptomyces hygroscopicus]|uniref:SDR family NAD(P)-dependent oxidoreductase n=1 Tax=Streptomyces hygroscopicus TaxID=1912 RepID=UPI0004C88218
TSQMDVIGEELAAAVAGLSPRASEVPLYSTVTGELLDTATMDAGYWRRNLREPVRFEAAVRALLDAGHGLFIEVSPHPVLTGAVQQTAEAVDAPVVALGTLRRGGDDQERLLTSLAQAHVHGADVDWSVWFEGLGARRVELPTYAFQRRRYWLESSTQTADVVSAGLGAAGHSLLGAAVSVAEADAAVVLTGRLSLHTHAWLADHTIGGSVLLPGTAFVELALRAGDEVGCDAVEELTLYAPLVFPAAGAVQVQVVVGEMADGRRPVGVYSRVENEQSPAEWVQHAGGTLVAGDRTEPDFELTQWPPAGAEAVSLEGFYAELAGRGYGYGPVFRGLESVWRAGGDLFAEVVLPAEADGFGVHPALLDAALHASLLDGDELRVPFTWAGVRLHAVGASTLRVRLSSGDEGALRLVAADADGLPVISVDKLRTQPMSPEALSAAATLGEDSLFEVRCVLEVVRGFLAEPGLGGVRLVVVTRGGMAEVPDPVTAAVWGLVRSAQTEYPGRVVLVDVDGDVSVGSLRGAVSVALGCGEPQVAVRGEGVLVPRLLRVGGVSGAVGVVGPVWDAVGTVLVTGASGVLAGVVARHLVVERGVRRLVLVSRSGAGAEGLVAELVAAGAEDVSFVLCDVADREGMAGVLAGVAEEYPLRGVVHAAGVLDDGVLGGLSGERLAGVLRPKVDGVLVLDELTRGLDLSAFVVFSSVAGVVGTAGQAAYAAANAFMDALMAVRRSEGLVGTSLAWGLWAAEGGMGGGLGERDLERVSRMGIVPMPVAEALGLF